MAGLQCLNAALQGIVGRNLSATHLLVLVQLSNQMPFLAGEVKLVSRTSRHHIS